MTACHPEDFENAGVIFGAGMTWKTKEGRFETAHFLINGD